MHPTEGLLVMHSSGAPFSGRLFFYSLKFNYYRLNFYSLKIVRAIKLYNYDTV